jgi:hypothetical protein
MSVCSPCYDAGSYVNACLTEFSFGTLPADDTEYIVWLQHNATKKIVQFTALTDDDGYINIEGIQLDPLQGYTIWVTDSLSSNVQLDITVDGDTYKCLSFSAASVGQSPVVIP